jgi:hypothetical protein
MHAQEIHAYKHNLSQQDWRGGGGTLRNDLQSRKLNEFETICETAFE